MPDWTDLKAWMAACWKVSWNVDPLAFRVPERAALLLDADEPPEDPLPPEDPQAATNEAIAAASPTVVTRWMRRRCMFKDPILRYSPVDSSGAGSTEAPHRPLTQPD
jgi:hypothetical protein